MGLHSEKDKPRYLTILADGKLHERVDEDVEGAKVRTKKDKDGNVEEVEDKDGNLIYELTYPGITAMVKKIKFNEGDYGTNINIDLEDEDDNKFTLSIKVSDNYGERFMEVLPNLNLNKEVEFSPYAFTPKGSSDKVRGLTIKQDDEKIESAFAVKDGDDWEVLIEGFPMPDPKKKYNSEKWKTFFSQRREWLMDYMVDADFIIAADAEPTDDAEPEDEEDSEEETTPKKKTAAKKGKKKDDDDDSF